MRQGHVRGTATEVNKVSDLVTKVKVKMWTEVQGRFDWDAIADNQDNFAVE